MCLTTAATNNNNAVTTKASTDGICSNDSNSTTRKISIREVEQHYMADDFWCVIDNVVYDLSNYDHPGGRIINLCPGTDCTAAFHQHHYDKKGQPHKVLKKFVIGVLDLSNSSKSPVMGEFYERCSEGVVNELKDRPYRPWKAVYIFIFDYLATFLLNYWSCCLLTSESPFWAVVFIPWLCECFAHRCTNHCHAIGHCQVLSDGPSKWAEIFMHAFGVGTMQVFAFPSEEGNLRRKMNENRKIAENEFWSGRGPYEHQGLHHPKALSFEDDGCFLFATADGWLRLANHQEPHWVHQFQKYEWYPFVIESGGVFGAFVYPIPFVLEAIYINFKNGMPLKALASILCLPWLAIGLYAVVISPMRCNLLAFVCLGLPLRFFMLTTVKLFFMQHRFDAEEDESLDWGVAQLKACHQTNMEGIFLWISPIFWFCEGCKPSTSAFHLEHTLYPGINYLNLPRVAKVVDRTCQEMGIPIDYKLQGWWEIQKAHRAIRLKYAPEYKGFQYVPPSSEKNKKNE